MRVAKLSADFSFRSLHLPEVLAGDDSAEIDWGLFAQADPIGDVWITRQVTFLDETHQPPIECCEASLSSAERGNRSEGEKPAGDFPHLWAINSGVLTERSYEVLHDLICPYVEFLPLTSSMGRFVAFKVLHIVDALNRNESVIEWYPQLKKDVGKPRIARAIKKFVFHEERLSEEVIFQLSELPLGTQIFVTERLVRTVEEHGLRGFQFTLVWPPVDDREMFLKKRLKRSKHA